MVLIDEYDLTPDIPPMIELDDASIDTLKLTWKVEDGLEYRLEWPTELGAWSGSILAPPVLRTSLRAGRGYDFRLRKRQKGTEAWSAPGDVQRYKTSYAMPLPLAAACIQVKADTTTASVEWAEGDRDAGAGGDAGAVVGAVERYRVKVFPSNGAADVDESTAPCADVFTTKPFCKVADLHPGTNYVAVVYRMAFNQWGLASPYIVFATATTPPNPIHVRDIEIGERCVNEVHLHWAVPVLNGSEIQQYEIAYRFAQPGGEEVERVEKVGDIPMAVLRHLPADAKVSLRIRGTNAGGTSEWSQWVDTRTVCPSTFATELTLLDGAIDSVRVGWRLVPTALHHVVRFTLEGKRGDFGFQTLCEVPVEAHEDADHLYEYALEPLPPAAVCHFRLRVSMLRDNEVVVSPPGTVHTFSSLPSRPGRPDAPSFVIDYQGPKFKWTAPKDHGKPLLHYLLRVPGHVDDLTLPAGSDTYWLPPQALQTGDEGFQYEVTVAAVNEVGLSAWSQPCRVRIDKRGALNPVSFNSAKA